MTYHCHFSTAARSESKNIILRTRWPLVREIRLERSSANSLMEQIRLWVLGRHQIQEWFPFLGLFRFVPVLIGLSEDVAILTEQQYLLFKEEKSYLDFLPLKTLLFRFPTQTSLNRDILRSKNTKMVSSAAWSKSCCQLIMKINVSLRWSSHSCYSKKIFNSSHRCHQSWGRDVKKVIMVMIL